MEPQSHTTTIILSILLVIALGAAAFLYFNLNGKITALESQLAAQSGIGAGDGAQASRDFESLQQLIRAYLQAEGRTCSGDVKTCLNDLMQTASTQGGPDCSLVSDGVCSAWCAADKDYDCCIEAGFEWQSGYGCRTDFPK